jgi:multimeric flavodoxin WrbA
MNATDKIRFTRDGQEVFDKILAIWPPLIRSGKRDKLCGMLSLLMQARRLRAADRCLVIEAARMFVPKSYDPLFHMMEDMQKFKREMLDTFTDPAVYNKIPVRVRRWKQVSKKRREKPSGPPPRVLAFCASPRTGGNTDLLIDEALNGCRTAGATTEKINLHKIDMGFCIGCRKCKEPDFDMVCVLKDDLAAIYRKIIDAQALIIGFPIYTGRECAQLSTFLDRWDGYERYLFSSFLQPGRIAMVIGTWGYPRIDTYDHVIENIITVLNMHKVTTVEALSACGFEGMLHGFDENRTAVIARHPRQLKKAFDAGRALVQNLY